MYKTGRTWNFILLTLTLAACNNMKINREEFMDEYLNAPHKIHITDIKDSTNILYSDVFTEVNYIPLECTLQSAIADVDKLEKLNDGGYLVFDRNNNKVLRFNKEGKFINKIGEVGKRKDEYIRVNDVVYLPTQQKIVIWDNPRHSLLVYTMEGKFLFSKEIDYWNGNLTRLADDKLVLYTNGDDGEHTKQYVVMDLDGKIYKVYRDRYADCVNFILSNPDMNAIGTSLQCRSEYSPLIYDLTSNSFSPKYSLDFSGNSIPIEWTDLNEDEFRDKISTEQATYCYRFHETSNSYIMTLCRKNLYLYISDKTNNQKTYAGFRAINDITGIKYFDRLKRFPGNVAPMMINDNKCYFIEDADNFKMESKWVKDLNEHLVKSEKVNLCIDTLSHEFRRFRMLSKNQNPVIVVCTLK